MAGRIAKIILKPKTIYDVVKIKNTTENRPRNISSQKYKYFDHIHAQWLKNNLQVSLNPDNAFLVV